MKVVLFGGAGQLGQALRRALDGHRVLAPSRTELDVTDSAAAGALLQAERPDAVINTAAYLNVPGCESNAAEAFATNATAVYRLAAAARQAGARFLTISTDYVFDGNKHAPYLESDATAPLQLYGISKLAGEHGALAAHPEGALVVRTCGLYGAAGARAKGGSFVDKRLAEGKPGLRMEMSADQVVSPTFVGDLAPALVLLLQHADARPGIYHLINEGECSWYQFTKAIYEIAGIAVDVIAVDRGGRTGEMRRPAYSALANRKAAALGITLPPWRDALERYLSALAARAAAAPLD